MSREVPTKERRGVLAAGNFIEDRVKFIDSYPPQQALANILSETSSNGGGAYNVLLDLGKLGADFSLEAAGRVGDDVAGRAIRENCERHGIDTIQLLGTPGSPTSYTDVMTVRETGQRTFFHQRGANSLFGPDDIDFEKGQANHLHLAYLLLLDGLDQVDSEGMTLSAQVLKRAKDAGWTTSVDVVSENSDRFPALVSPCLPYVDCAFMNEFEVARTSGIEVMSGGRIDRDKLRSAADAIMEFGCGELIVHMPEGAMTYPSRRWQGSLKLPTERVVNTVGAGDAFAAGFLFAIYAGTDPLLAGAACAASCISGAGCSDGVVPMPECLSLAGRYGFNDPPWS